MQQATLDTYMVEEGIARYRKDVASARQREEEASTKYGQRLLAANILPFADDIAAWKAKVAKAPASRRAMAYPPLSKLSAEVIAFIVTRTVLDGIGLSVNYARVCITVGSAIEDEVRNEWLRKNHPGLFKKLERQLAHCHSYDHRRAVIVHAMFKAGIAVDAGQKAEGVEAHEAWSVRLKTQIGAVLVDLMAKSTGLVQTVSVRMGKRLTNVVQATPKTTEWIRGYNEYAEVLDPVWLPMVEAPAKWEAPHGGGYTSDLLPPAMLVKRSTAEYLTKTLPKAVMPEVYDAINALQETPWAINRRVFGVMQHLWDAGRTVGGLPQSEDEQLPAKPVDIETNIEARSAWKQRAARVHVANAALRSTRLQARKLLNLAQKFSNVDRFYFPYQLDFRGRVYTIPTFLTPQGSDLARALLTFAEGATINDDNDAYWLGVYGANLFGKDKVSFEDRLAWVASERANILAVAADPLGCQWWQTADKPWQFLAWCIEWSGWLTKGPGFTTTLPVCIDGTNNGLQILSMLTRDEDAARATNVLPSDTPADIYADVARRVMDLMRGDEENEHAAFWLSFGIDRKTTKRPVMVLPYGGTFHSCRDYVAQWYAETAKARGIEVPEFKLVAQRCHYLAQRIWEGIDYCVGRPRQAMVWLQSCAVMFTEAGLPITWTAPTGFPVLQAYKDQRSITVQTSLGDRIRCIDIAEEIPNSLSRARQKNGISPNFVHSCDAAALSKTTALCLKQGIKSFAMIHDSYGTHAPRVHEMAAALRVAFASIFSEDQLLRLRAELQAQLDAALAKDKDGNPLVLPTVPAYGGLDVRSLLNSEFFFA